MVLMLVTAFLGGCAGKDFSAIRPGIESRGHYIEGVPFYKQSESTCGPAALAGVFAFRGRPENVDEITAKVFLPQLRGTLPMDMESYARERGFHTSSSAGTLADLKDYIRKGVPVICMLDLGFSLYHQPHYVTVIGYDDVNRLIVEHDGVRPNRLVAYEKFDTAWARAGRWMLVITP